MEAKLRLEIDLLVRSRGRPPRGLGEQRGGHDGKPGGRVDLDVFDLQRPIWLGHEEVIGQDFAHNEGEEHAGPGDQGHDHEPGERAPHVHGRSTQARSHALGLLAQADAVAVVKEFDLDVGTAVGFEVVDQRAHPCSHTVEQSQ